MIKICCLLCLLAAPVWADSVLASRTIPARTIIGPSDIIVQEQQIAGAITHPDRVIGMEALVALFAGRAIRAGDIGVPATVERNEIIALYYLNNGLIISTDARALGRAGPGDKVRVMNLASRSTVTAIIGNDGAAYVHQ